jgi:glutamate decarboxylase
MPAAADKLMLENMSKNLIDQDEYPATRKCPFDDRG